MPLTRKSRKSSSGHHHFASYKTYYSHILKVAQPGCGLTMSSKSVAILDSMMNDMFERIATAAAQLMKKSKRKILTERDVKFATELVLPGELRTCGNKHGEQAVDLYKKSKNEQENELPPNSLESRSSAGLAQESSEELLYETFRSNVRGHSSPILRIRNGILQ
ncbi:histone H2B [Folsomia candida]|uniref:Histone H2B type 3-A n=1 Tax=Folsomia candida TaxID=158441 RepID=A0A226F2J0_FOLCA|nr:histone H2B [Folsomia candida]OXA63391.1 Histone H2B type 3-A [Folsomia candida]